MRWKTGRRHLRNYSSELDDLSGAGYSSIRHPSVINPPILRDFQIVPSFVASNDRFPADALPQDSVLTFLPLCDAPSSVRPASMTGGPAPVATNLGVGGALTMRIWFEKHSLAGSLIIWLADLVFVIGGALLLSALFPNIPGYGRGISQSLILVLLGVVLVAALLSAFHWWRRAGFVGISEWRDLRILWLPVLLLLVPFVGGFRPLAGSELLVLIIGYAATGFFEEAIYRGVMLSLLRPKGIWTAVLISSLLFGLAHFSNVILRGNVPLTALQAFGSAVGGIGLAALRLRTRSIWPVIALHALHDLFFQLGGLPVPISDAINSTVLMLYAIYLLRPVVREKLEEERVANPPTTAAASALVE